MNFNQSFNFCMAHCRPGLALDLGANTGDWSQAMLDRGLQVIAIEPGRDCIEKHLQLRFQNYGDQFQSIWAAAHNFDGRVRLWEQDAHWMNSVSTDLVDQGWGFDHNRHVEVRAVRLDTLAQEMDFSSLSFIKVDVESSEQWVLEGAAEVIQRYRPLIYLETHSAINSAAINALFDSWNYRITSDGSTAARVRDLNGGNDEFICFHADSNFDR
jgi:FkbM family methyltransferase